MRNITPPRTVSFEDALKNLACRLTGTPVEALPSTQEGIVQYMAENLNINAPTVDVDALAEAITNEVLARLEASIPDASTTGADGGQEAPEGLLDIVDGHFTAESLEKMTIANLSKLAEALGANISECKKKADFVAILAQVDAQVNTNHIITE